MEPNKQVIREYLNDFILALEGKGMIVTNYNELEKELDRISEYNYPILRNIFVSGEYDPFIGKGE